MEDDMETLPTMTDSAGTPEMHKHVDNIKSVTNDTEHLPDEDISMKPIIQLSINQSIDRLMYPIAGINLNYRKGQRQQTYLALAFNRNKVIKTGCAA